MKLYELKNGDTFIINEGTLLETTQPTEYILDHIDGMYSLCYPRNGGMPVHWSASTPVFKVENPQ